VKTESKDIAAERIETSESCLRIHLPERTVDIAWQRCSPRLAQATTAQRTDVQLSPGGFGIHWPQLDEDLSIAGLVRAAEGR